MSFRSRRAIANFLVLVLLSSCSSGPIEDEAVTTTPSPVTSAVQNNNVKNGVTITPIESKSPSSSQSASDEPQVKSAQSATPEVSTSKSPSQQVIPKKTKKPSQSPTSQKLPDRYEIWKAYPWEEDPTRYGIPYTDKKPTQYVKTGAIFMLPENKLLLVRADLVVSRTADLYRDVLSAEIVEEEKVYLVIATCLDGSKTTLAGIPKIAWLPGQHPSTFWFSAIQDNGRACDN